MSVKTYMGAGRSIGFVWIHVLPHKIPLHCLRAQLRGRLFAEASSTSVATQHSRMEPHMQRGQALHTDLRVWEADDERQGDAVGQEVQGPVDHHPEETGTPVDMLGFTFTSGRNGRMELDTEYNNIPKLADDGLDSLSILVILKTLEMWAQKGYELFQPIAQRFHGGRR